MIYKDILPYTVPVSDLGVVTHIDDTFYQILLDYNTDYSYVVDEDRKVIMYFDSSCNGYNLKGDVVVRLHTDRNSGWGYTFGDYSDTVWCNCFDIFRVELQAAVELMNHGKL